MSQLFLRIDKPGIAQVMHKNRKLRQHYASFGRFEFSGQALAQSAGLVRDSAFFSYHTGSGEYLVQIPEQRMYMSYAVRIIRKAQVHLIYQKKHSKDFPVEFINFFFINSCKGYGLIINCCELMYEAVKLLSLYAVMRIIILENKFMS